MEAEFKRCLKSGGVLCLRHSTISFREKKYVLNFSRFFINDLSFSVSFLFLFLLFFFFFFSPPILTDPWWKTNDLQYQKE